MAVTKASRQGRAAPRISTTYVYTWALLIVGSRGNYVSHDISLSFFVEHCCETMSNKKERELLDACRDGNLEKVRSLVDSKQVDPRRVIDTRLAGFNRTPFNKTPLHYACK